MKISESDIRDWNNKKIELHKKYPYLTESDLLWREGPLSDLLKELADRIGISWRELELIIKDL